MGCRRSPFLNMRTTLAVVQSIGIVPCFNEAWKNSVNVGVSSSASVFWRYYAVFRDGTCFLNLSASCGHSFCDSSNRLLSSLLVMFLRARRWPVGACAFHIQPAKRMSTFVLPVG